jgi:hypothetical protein
MKNPSKLAVVTTASIIVVASIGLTGFGLSKLIETVPCHKRTIFQTSQRCAMEAESHAAEEPEISQHDVWQ